MLDVEFFFIQGSKRLDEALELIDEVMEEVPKTGAGFFWKRQEDQMRIRKTLLLKNNKQEWQE